MTEPEDLRRLLPPEATHPSRALDAPSAEEREIDLLRGEVLGLRRHVAMLQAECDRLANCDSHGWRNRAENAERDLAAVREQANRALDTLQESGSDVKGADLATSAVVVLGDLRSAQSGRDFYKRELERTERGEP
jgi:hypothetical protein